MRPNTRSVSIVLAALAWLVIASPSSAEPKRLAAPSSTKATTKRAVGATTKKKKKTSAAAESRRIASVSELTEGGYGYDFEDDPLHAEGSGAHTARIRVRPQGVRGTLIRPRLHFIPEMLRSVEDL